MKYLPDSKSIIYILMFMWTIVLTTLLLNYFETFIYKLVTVFIAIILSSNSIAKLYLRLIVGHRP